MIETAFLNEFNFLQYAIERLLVFGYAPVMAHPEKFNYLFEEDKKINILRKMGLKFQVDLDAFLESTIKTKKDNLKYLINNNLIDFIGSNVHSLDSVVDLMNLKENANFQQMLKAGVQNQSLRF